MATSPFAPRVDRFDGGISTGSWNGADAAAAGTAPRWDDAGAEGTTIEVDDGGAALIGATDAGASVARPVDEGAASTARDFLILTVGRMRSSFKSGDFCRSRWRFTRSTTSVSTALMWFRTSPMPMDWKSDTSTFWSMLSCLATS